MRNLFKLFNEAINLTSSHTKMCTIMGVVYFYKTICCMFGADVAMLLNSSHTYSLAAS